MGILRMLILQEKTMTATLYGGSLSCTSEPGEGAEFKIRVPVRQEVSNNVAVGV